MGNLATKELLPLKSSIAANGPDEEDVFLCDAVASADAVVPAADADVFLETMSMTVDAIEDPPSGLSRDPFEVVLDPAATNGLSGFASGGPGAVSAGAAASACGGFSLSFINKKCLSIFPMCVFERCVAYFA